VGPNLMTFAKG